MSCTFCGCDPEANHTCERHRGNLSERLQSVQLANYPQENFEFSADIKADLMDAWQIGAGAIRTFDTGATRNLEEGKYDYEAFLSPLVLERFAAYMHANRLQADGTLRDGDNWQKGIPMSAYMKSGWRHFFEWWKWHRRAQAVPLHPSQQTLLEDALCALLFNVMGYLFEYLRRSQLAGQAQSKANHGPAPSSGS